MFPVWRRLGEVPVPLLKRGQHDMLLDMEEPQAVIKAWLPHILVLALLGLGAAVLVQIMRPLLDPLVLAAAIALVTGPVLFSPLSRWSKKIPVQTRYQRLCAATASTTLIIVAAVSPIVLLLGSTIRSLGDGYNMVIGFLARDPETLDRMEVGIAHQVDQVHQLYPQLQLNQLNLAEQIMDALGQASSVNYSVVDFMRTGTGFIAQQIITILCLVWFFAEGPRIIRSLMLYSPLGVDQQDNLIRVHRTLVLRLISGTFGTALVKGMLIAGVVVGFHAGNGQSLPYIPMAILATIIGILPVIGLTLIWLPVSLLMWSSGSPGMALAMASCCLIADIAVSTGRRLAWPHIEDGGISWSFFLMLGILGGLLQYQLKGLIIGPMTVIFVGTLATFWLPLYGIGTQHRRPHTTDESATSDPKMPVNADQAE